MASGEIYRLTCQMSAIGVYGKVGRTPRYKREGIGAWLRSRSRSCRWGYPYVRQGLGSGSLTGSEYRQRKTQQGRTQVYLDRLPRDRTGQSGAALGNGSARVLVIIRRGG